MTIKNKKKLLSIVIKGEHIKICVVSKNGKNLKVHSALTADTPKGAVSDGLIEDAESLEKTLRKVLTTNSISVKDVIFSIVSGKMFWRLGRMYAHERFYLRNIRMYEYI